MTCRPTTSYSELVLLAVLADILRPNSEDIVVYVCSIPLSARTGPDAVIHALKC